MKPPRSKLSLALFIAGVMLLVVVALLGRDMQDEVAALGMNGYQAAHGSAGILRFLLFAFGFPAGFTLCALGALLGGPVRPGEMVSFTVIAAVGVAAAVLVPALFGRQPAPAFFGIGGIAIAILVVTGSWLWGRRRGQLDGPLRGAADLQAAGYFCFALAAWNLCGSVGMPSFLLYPEQAIAQATQPFAIGQVKTVMALLVLGWALSVLGLYRATRAHAHSGASR